MSASCNSGALFGAQAAAFRLRADRRTSSALEGSCGVIERTELPASRSRAAAVSSAGIAAARGQRRFCPSVGLFPFIACSAGGGETTQPAQDFVDVTRQLGYTPYLSQNVKRPGGSAIDRRTTTRHAGYATGQACLARVERVFGWMKPRCRAS